MFSLFIGLEQFWTDDYKIFEQVYGKTSDKEIYGATLPPSISFAEPKLQASEKKERYLSNYKEPEDIDPYGYGDKFHFLTKPGKKEKPATSTFNFVSYSDFKPISQNSDPETYTYLKHLEETEREKNAAIKGTGGFKPYLNYVGPDPEETDAYKSIQDILNAHEANKGNEDEDDGNSKYLMYREKNNANKVNKKKPPRKVNEVSKPRCLPGRCRKRSSVPYRVRSRPYYRRIKHRIY